MGRAKIKMELIQDYKKRMTTLVTRKTGLVKKISELSILCDIKACMIIHEGNNHQIWPNDPNEVTELINLYKNHPFQGRSKCGKTLSNYFENDEKKRAGIKVEKDPPTWDSRFDYFENDEKKKVEIKVEKYPTWDSRFDYLSEKELQNLAGVVEKKIKGKIELLKSMNVHIGSCSVSHQQIWDNNLMNQTTLSLWPISNVNSFTDYNNFFQSNIPISGMIEAENWSANVGIGSSSTMQPMGSNGIGSTSTMQPMGNNGIGSSSTMQQPMDQYPFIYNDSTRDIASSSTMQPPMDQYPFIYNDSTRDIASSSTMQPIGDNGIGSSSTMQPMGNNGIGSSLIMQPMGNNGIGSSLTMQPMNQYPFMYNDSTHAIGSSSTVQPMDQYPFVYNESTHDISYSFV
ncbi:MADS-box transcription factor 3-like [Solanum verrucosum]|uniref:MADS-box transcription factor 3-like n=1 Tax=Solanum verrucosum TaxID=315347 RepID=UPI0020D1005A|nr:MADS-box transcription factor 3-like [Solanum verrucosum]